MIIPHPKHPTGGYWMEKELYENIILLPKRIEKDKDVVGLFVGSPGEGKSTIALQVMYVLNKNLSLDSIKYTYEDYVRYSMRLFHAGKSKGMGVIHDEAKEVVSGLKMVTSRTKKFNDFLYENRQMNMYQFLLTGDFFDLPKTIVMQRALFMVWVHEEGEFDNGYFKFYNRPDMRKLYWKGKKQHNMEAHHKTFRGRFPKFYTVDEEGYRKLKLDNFKEERYIDGKLCKPLTTKEILYKALERNPDVDVRIFAKLFKYDLSGCYAIVRQWKKDGGDKINIGGDQNETS